MAEPATPIAEQIAVALAAAIADATTANGYQINVASVKRGSRVAVAIDDSDVLLEPMGAVEDENNRSPGGIGWIAGYTVTAAVIPSDSETAALDTLTNLAAAELLRAIMADVTLGGIAFPGVWPKAIDGLLNPDGSFAGVQIELTVGYRTLEADPYTRS